MTFICAIFDQFTTSGVLCSDHDTDAPRTILSALRTTWKWGLRQKKAFKNSMTRSFTIREYLIYTELSGSFDFPQDSVPPHFRFSHAVHRVRHLLTLASLRRSLWGPAIAATTLDLKVRLRNVLRHRNQRTQHLESSGSRRAIG